MLLKGITVKNAWFVTIGFLVMGLNLQNFVCNGWHDLIIFCLNLRDIAIITATNVDYRCIICNMRKPDTIYLLENVMLDYCGYI